jgi:hypothetical protein
MTQKAPPQPEATPSKQVETSRQVEDKLWCSAGAQFTCFTTRIKVFYYRRRSSCGALQVLSLFVLLLGQKYLPYYRRRINCGALQTVAPQFLHYSLYEGSIKALFRLFSGSFKELSEFCEGSIKSL